MGMFLHVDLRSVQNSLRLLLVGRSSAFPGTTTSASTALGRLCGRSDCLHRDRRIAGFPCLHARTFDLPMVGMSRTPSNMPDCTPQETELLTFPRQEGPGWTNK